MVSGARGGVSRRAPEKDLRRLDEAGQVRVAYPFSAVPTPHRVAIDGGPAVFSMCSVDAIGIAAMLGRAVTVHSADPVTGEPITVMAAATGHGDVDTLGHGGVRGPARLMRLV